MIWYFKAFPNKKKVIKLFFYSRQDFNFFFLFLLVNNWTERNLKKVIFYIELIIAYYIVYIANELCYFFSLII